MFVQISPNENDVSETLCSLNFASRVRGVELGPAKKNFDISELSRQKQLVEKSKQDIKSKDMHIKRMEESIYGLELKMKARDISNKNLQDKVRELESQLLIERKLARQHVDTKIAEQQQQQQQQQEEQHISSMKPLLVARQLGNHKHATEPATALTKDLVNVIRPLTENNSNKLHLSPPPDNNSVLKCNKLHMSPPPDNNSVFKCNKTQKENKPEMPEQPLVPARTGRASICTTARRVPIIPAPRRNSLIPFPAAVALQPLPDPTAILPPLPPLPLLADPIKEETENNCPEPTPWSCSKGPKSSKKISNILRRSVQKKVYISPLHHHIRRGGGLNGGTEKVRISIGSRGRLAQRVLVSNANKVKEGQQKLHQDEVLVKREELLQFAQGAITGLKLNADVVRIDAEASALQQKLEGMKTSRVPSTEGEEITPVETTHATLEALKQALAEVRVCSKLEALLLKKKSLNNGDSPDIRSQKVDKLKVLADSLASSTLKAEKRISDHRHQKEEALNFRLAKANEVTELEKEISTEIAGLEKQRDELEAKLKKVNISLAAALARLHNNREEREKFEEASNQIVLHLKAKEDELSRSVASSKVEADVVHTWINFLEDTWILQSSYMDQKEKQNNDELEKHNNYFMNVVIHHLSAYKEELGHYVIQIRKLVDNLKNFDKRSAMMSNLGTENSNQLKNLEVEYLEYEAKIITTFSVVDHMKEQFYSHDGNISRHDEPKVKELFDAIEQIKVDFESIERPTLEIETPSEEGSQKSQSHTIQSSESSPQEGEESSNSAAVTKPSKEGESPKSATVTVTIPSKEGESHTLDAEAELAKLESEFGKVNRDYSVNEIGGWEFDELEQELKSGDSVSAK